MNSWIPLTSIDQIEGIVQKSQELPAIIFKHSTTCSISSIASLRLKDLAIDPSRYSLHYLDLLRYRQVSHGVAEKLDVYHESPQIIVLYKKEVVLDSSHLDIKVGEIKEVLQEL